MEGKEQKRKISNKKTTNIIHKKSKSQRGITLLVLVITIVLNCSYLAMDQMNKIEKI